MDEKEKEVLKLKIEVLETLLALRDMEIQKLNKFIKEERCFEITIKNDKDTFINKLFKR